MRRLRLLAYQVTILISTFKSLFCFLLVLEVIIASMGQLLLDLVLHILHLEVLHLNRIFHGLILLYQLLDVDLASEVALASSAVIRHLVKPFANLMWHSDLILILLS